MNKYAGCTRSGVAKIWSGDGRTNGGAETEMMDENVEGRLEGQGPSVVSSPNRDRGGASSPLPKTKERDRTTLAADFICFQFQTDRVGSIIDSAPLRSELKNVIVGNRGSHAVLQCSIAVNK